MWGTVERGQGSPACPQRRRCYVRSGNGKAQPSLPGGFVNMTFLLSLSLKTLGEANGFFLHPEGSEMIQLLTQL